MREKLFVWFNGREERRANMIQNLFLLARLAFLVDIFGMLNVLNITLQGCEIDIFEATSKITSFKQKLESLEKEICSNNLQNLKRFSPSCLHVSGKKNRIWSSVSL